MHGALALIAVASVASCEKKPGSAQVERSKPTVVSNADVEPGPETPPSRAG